MAKIFKAPIEAPKITATNMDDYVKLCDKYLRDLVALAKKNKGELCGEIIRFGVADGYAVYVVWNEKPLQLVHVDTWDGYYFQYDYLLTIKEVREQVKREKSLRELFSGQITPNCGMIHP